MIFLLTFSILLLTVIAVAASLVTYAGLEAVLESAIYRAREFWILGAAFTIALTAWSGVVSLIVSNT